MYKKSILTTVVTALVAALIIPTLALSGCAPAPPVVITMGGSTTVLPLAEKLALAYEAKFPHVDVRVEGGGSTAGITNVAKGILDIGNSSRPLRPAELERWPDLIPHPLAFEAIVLLVHPTNPIENLTIEEIRDIFATGFTPEWTPISREAGSGARGVFEDAVMKKTKISPKCLFFHSAGMIKEAIAVTPKGIGFSSLAYVDATVKPIKVNGIPPTIETILDGTYPILSMFLFVTKGEPTGEVKKFIDWSLSPEGQKVVEKEGFGRVK